MARYSGHRNGDGGFRRERYAGDMNAHRNLEVWQRAHRMAIRVHRMTAGGVLDRAPVLVDQVRRAVESIADNIAEGRGGRTNGVYLRHIGIALESASEADGQFRRLKDREEWDAEVAYELLDELAIIRRQLIALELTVKRRPEGTRGSRASRVPRR